MGRLKVYPLFCIDLCKKTATQCPHFTQVKYSGLHFIAKVCALYFTILCFLSILRSNFDRFLGGFFIAGKILPPKKQDLMTPSRKSRDFSHGMDRPLLSHFMGLFVCFCIFLVIDIFLYNFFAHIAQCTHIVTWRPKMTAPILATSYFWMIL